VKKILILFAVVLLASSCSAIKTLRIFKSLHSGSVTQKDFHVIIPYTEKLGLRALPVKLNGSETTYSFIFDTGAGATVVSDKLVKELNLKKIGAIQVTDSRGQGRKQEFVVIEELNIGGIIFHNIGAVVMDYDSLSVIPCIGKDGILGINAISLASWTVDNAQKQFDIFDGPVPTDERLTQELPFTQKALLPYVNVTLDGHTYRNVLVDMGANSGITLPLESFTHNQSLEDNRYYMRVDGSTQGLFGNRTDTTYTVEADELKLGDITLRKQCMETSQYNTSKIGNKVWDDYVEGLDFKNSRIVLMRRTDRDSAYKPMSGLGLSISRQNGKVTITSLFENSPATKAGLRYGDEITAINGRPVDSYYPIYCDFSLWAAGEFKNMKEVTLTVAGKSEPIHLVAAPYGYMRADKN
jgi:predicted aspartyl protease